MANLEGVGHQTRFPGGQRGPIAPERREAADLLREFVAAARERGLAAVPLTARSAKSMSRRD